MLGKKIARFVSLNAHVTSDQRHWSHLVLDLGGSPLSVGVGRVGDDSEQFAVIINNWQARNTVLGAERIEFLDGRFFTNGYRVGHHSGFGTLDLANLLRLLFDR